MSAKVEYMKYIIYTISDIQYFEKIGLISDLNNFDYDSLSTVSIFGLNDMRSRLIYLLEEYEYSSFLNLELLSYDDFISKKREQFLGEFLNLDKL